MKARPYTNINGTVTMNVQSCQMVAKLLELKRRRISNVDMRSFREEN